MGTGLPISRLINVSVNLAPKAAQFPNLSTLLVLGTSAVIDAVERLRNYSSLAAVAADFGTMAQEYLSAVLWFEQRPSPTTLTIGRWLNAASHGQLIGGALSAAHQLASFWAAIGDGSIRVTVDGGSLQTLTNIDFTGATNMNGVAAIIDAAIAGATVVWNSVYSRFEITSASTGTGSTIAVQAGLTGTDITSPGALIAGVGGAYVANGLAAESALAAVTLFDNQFSTQFYGLTIPSATSDDHLAVAAYIEADAISHFYGVSTEDAGSISSVSTTDIGYLLKQQNFRRTAWQYSSSNAYAVVSLLGRILTTNWQANNTAITLMYKQEPGITAETLTETQIDALEAKNGNVFVTYNNDTAIIEQGKCASGDYIDSVIGIDWLRGQIQTNLYNLLYQSPSKIPQTDAGNHQLATGIEAACQQGVVNGLLGPGVWNSNGFGQIEAGDFLSKGFYVYTPPITSQSQADREQRKSVPFQVAAKLAGAVHTADVIVDVNS